MANVTTILTTLLAALALTSGAGAQRRPVPPLPKQPVTTRPASGPATTWPTAPPAAPNPLAGLSPQDQELVRMVQLQVTQQIEQIRTGQARQRERAHQTIFQLHHQLLVPLDASRNRGIAPRDASRLLADWSREIRLVRVGIELGPAATVRLRKLRDTKPDILERLISDDPAAQSEGFRLLQQWPDPNQLAEPLVLRTLRNNPSLARQALLLFQKDRYLSPAALEGLLPAYEDCLAALQRREQNPPSATAAQAALREQILQVLPKFKDPRLPPVLLQTLLDHRYINIAGPVADGLVKNNALGAVSVLMDNLRDDEPIMRSGAGTMTYSANDALLYVVLKLTGLPPGDYGLRVDVFNGRVATIGFADDEVRKTAIEKLRTWWAENRDKPPYCDAKPIRVRN